MLKNIFNFLLIVFFGTLSFLISPKITEAAPACPSGSGYWCPAQNTCVPTNYGDGFSIDGTISTPGTMTTGSTITITANASSCSSVSCLLRSSSTTINWPTNTYSIPNLGCSPSGQCNDDYTVTATSNDPNCINPPSQTIRGSGANGGPPLSANFSFSCQIPTCKCDAINQANICDGSSYSYTCSNGLTASCTGTKTCSSGEFCNTSNNQCSSCTCESPSSYTCGQYYANSCGTANTCGPGASCQSGSSCNGSSCISNTQPSCTVSANVTSQKSSSCSNGSDVSATITPKNISSIAKTVWTLNGYQLGDPSPLNTTSRNLACVGYGFGLNLNTQVQNPAGTTVAQCSTSFDNPAPNTTPPPASGTGSQQGNLGSLSVSANPGCNGDGSTAHVDISWNSVPGASYYEVWRRFMNSQSKHYCMKGRALEGGSPTCDIDEKITGTGYRDEWPQIYAPDGSANSISYLVKACTQDRNCFVNYSQTYVSPEINLTQHCLADLVVTDTNDSPATITPGQSISLSGIVRNQGLGAKASPSLTRLFINNVMISDSYATNNTIDYNSSRSVNWTVTNPPSLLIGTNGFRICADSTNTAAETNEGNNCTYSNFQVTSACDSNRIGTNQLLGCYWNKGSNVSFTSDFPSAVTVNSPSVQLSNPVPDTAVVLDQNWSSSAPATGVTTDNFSAKWRGTFTFKKGTYTFYARSDDGMKVKINGVYVVNGWPWPPPYNPYAYVDYTFTDTNRFSVPIEVEYFENSGGANVHLEWTYTPALDSSPWVQFNGDIHSNTNINLPTAGQ